ncbi:MAG: toll/interleukin-1 receptor domain-containing protein [Acidobacteria bacterium]|nr:toll/interleukin-1 receptor domain-containing protein [Acidobacteriota bacterium]MBV9067233.1 toll/interleukin-1 receptor domain-containing protein [Acidobacteriota bacterium]MBV9186488.1 toll/interleukin-1 receptor domain-containing protein [Acidobacteriota bacterium]
MKSEFKKVEVAVAVAGALASTIGLLAFYFQPLSFQPLSLQPYSGFLEKLLMIAGPMIGLLLGWQANAIASNLRKLQRARRVFLSYTANDRQFAFKVADRLKAAGMKVWAAGEHITPGTSIRAAVDKALGDADVLVAVLSHDASAWVTYEVAEALRRGVRVIPVLMPNTELPSELHDVVYVDATESEQEAINGVAEALA